MRGIAVSLYLLSLVFLGPQSRDVERTSVLRFFCVPKGFADLFEPRLYIPFYINNNNKKMKTKQLLIKTLLVAVGLLMGASAWADGSKRVLNSQNYESAATTDWTCPNAVTELVAGDVTYGIMALTQKVITTIPVQETVVAISLSPLVTLPVPDIQHLL